ISQVDATGSAGAAFAAGFSVIAGATIVVNVNDVDLNLAALSAHFIETTANGLDTYTAISNVFDGSETINATASLTDTAGNTNSDNANLVIDTTAPVVTIATVAAGGSFNAGFTVTEGATVFVN
ncbi:hypothetical protein QN391_25670, partial [Pseudomonas sp. CCI1.2]|uniref:hypothetical protein n=1 Tax=Pseudomonas sp. CCI1.2 TaxID=3048614 RepID=UPI002B230FC5